MAGFRVDEARHDAVDGVEHLMRVLDLAAPPSAKRVYWSTARPPQSSRTAMATRNGHRHLPRH